MPLLEKLNTPVKTIEDALLLSAVINGVVHYYLESVPDKSAISPDIKTDLERIESYFLTARAEICQAILTGFREKLSVIENQLSNLGCRMEDTAYSAINLRLNRIKRECKHFHESDFKNDPLKVQRIWLALKMLTKDYFHVLSNDSSLHKFKNEIKKHKKEFFLFLKQDLQQTYMVDSFDLLREAVGEWESKIKCNLDIDSLLVCYRSLIEVINSDRKVREHIFTPEDIKIVANCIDDYLQEKIDYGVPADYLNFKEHLKFIKTSAYLSIENLIPLLTGNYLFALSNLIYNYFYNEESLNTLDAFSATANILEKLRIIFDAAKVKAIQMGNNELATNLLRYKLNCEFGTIRNMRIMLPINGMLGELRKVEPKNTEIMQCINAMEAVANLQQNKSYILQARKIMRDYCSELRHLIETPDKYFLGFIGKSSPKQAYNDIKNFFEGIIGNSDETQYVMISNKLTEIVKKHGLEKRINNFPTLKKINDYYDNQANFRLISPPMNG